MTTRSATFISHVLASQGDVFDPHRCAVLAAVRSGALDVRDQAYALANALWEPVANAAWNEGERSPTVFGTCFQVRDLCRWTILFEATSEDAPFDIAGSQTVQAMVEHVLGNSEESLELLARATDRGTNQYFWESASEKFARILIDLERYEEAVAKLEEIQAAHPGNTFSRNCLEAFEFDGGDQGDEPFAGDLDHLLPAGATPTPEQISAITVRLTARFQAEMASLMEADLTVEERTVKMNEAQQEFMAAMQRMSTLTPE